MNQHTPGPWNDRLDETRPDWRIVFDQTGIDVAHCPPWGGSQVEANAALIAAAPTMFAALQQIIGRCENSTPSVTETIAIIKIASAALDIATV